MNKKELKKEFEKEFEKISVSNELKIKTLNSIKSTPSVKYRPLSYLKNFAAVFIVTALCISIYWVNQPQESLDSTKEITSGAGITYTPSSVQSISTKQNKLLASPEAINAVEEFSKAAPYFEYSENNNSLERAAILESDSDIAELTTEKEFLSKYPEAKKVENGYMLYENGKEKIYVFNNNELENIIIID